MTLILTHLSLHGIIHASDSNLTSSGDVAAGQSQKTFPIPHLQAGLTVAGSYSVGGKEMRSWMTDFIQKQATNPTGTLASFAETLRTALEAEMTSGEKRGGSLIHIAG